MHRALPAALCLLGCGAMGIEGAPTYPRRRSSRSAPCRRAGLPRASGGARLLTQPAPSLARRTTDAFTIVASQPTSSYRTWPHRGIWLPACSAPQLRFHHGATGRARTLHNPLSSSAAHGTCASHTLSMPSSENQHTTTTTPAQFTVGTTRQERTAAPAQSLAKRLATETPHKLMESILRPAPDHHCVSAEARRRGRAQTQLIKTATLWLTAASRTPHSLRYLSIAAHSSYSRNVSLDLGGAGGPRIHHTCTASAQVCHSSSLPVRPARAARDFACVVFTRRRGQRQ